MSRCDNTIHKMEKDCELIRQTYLEHREPIEKNRIEYAKRQLENLGYSVTSLPEQKALTFLFNGNTITFYPYKGWFSGKGVTPGRGLKNLLDQLNAKTNQQMAYHTLSPEDREDLMSMGHPESDLHQIEEAVNRSSFILHRNGERKRITAAEATKILGRHKFLAGIGRSAFHFTSCQANGKDTVHFDSSIIFKKTEK